MQKAKLGVSIGALGAAVCFLGLFGSYIAVVVAVGYVLLFEENEWLKKNSVKVLAVMLTMSFLGAVIGLIPDVIGLISSLLNIFGGSFSIPVISSIIYFLGNAIDLLNTLILLGMGLKSFNQGTITIPVIDAMIDKYMN